jgi:hypothetical protein
MRINISNQFISTSFRVWLLLTWTTLVFPEYFISLGKLLDHWWLWCCCHCWLPFWCLLLMLLLLLLFLVICLPLCPILPLSRLRPLCISVFFIVEVEADVPLTCFLTSWLFSYSLYHDYSPFQIWINQVLISKSSLVFDAAFDTISPSTSQNKNWTSCIQNITCIKSESDNRSSRLEIRTFLTDSFHESENKV